MNVVPQRSSLKDENESTQHDCCASIELKLANDQNEETINRSAPWLGAEAVEEEAFNKVQGRL